ncbi:MAG: polysaccharide deacetylase family protein [Phycisphaeraceae bacterium]
MTIDVEEYFHIEAAYGRLTPDAVGRLPKRAEAAMDTLLELFDRCNVRATLFFLAEVARDLPGLVKRCQAAGHEIASHGSGHDRLHRLSPVALAGNLDGSRRRLEDLIGEPVLGYRAPTWSLTRETAWAVEVLAAAGFAYDASIFPVHHPQYGVASAPTRPYFLRGANGGRVLEVPPLVYELAGRNVACAGGGWFRLMPPRLMRLGLRQASLRNRPAVLYFHPWEFDPDIPRLPLGWVGRVRTYTGLRRSLQRLECILQCFDGWSTIRERLPEIEASASQQPAFTLATTKLAAAA